MELTYSAQIYSRIGHSVSRCASKNDASTRVMRTMRLCITESGIENIIGKFPGSSVETQRVNEIVNHAINTKSSGCRRVLTRSRRFRYDRRATPLQLHLIGENGCAGYRRKAKSFSSKNVLGYDESQNKMSEGIIEDIRMVNRRVKSIENADGANERLEEQGTLSEMKKFKRRILS